jgi:hypothetical protein
MVYVDKEETRVNTHPIGYIGADNKGFDQALATPGGKNRNSHGTFSFPGRYHNIGPAGTTEQISVHLAPVGPAFSSGWNVSGPAPGFHVYQPLILPSVFPLGLQDSFRNDPGFFNFTPPVLFNLPPLDFFDPHRDVSVQTGVRTTGPGLLYKGRVAVSLLRTVVGCNSSDLQR